MTRPRTASTGKKTGAGRRAGLAARAALLLALSLALLQGTEASAASMGAGYQWYWLAPSPQGNAIAGIDFVGGSRGWAVGAAGTILRTTNGGASWKQLASGTGRPLASVSFPTSLQGWVVGSGGLIRHTADGGSHWASQASGTTASLRGVAFADAKHGWAVGIDTSGDSDAPVVLATIDGGLHWRAQSSPAGGGLAAVDCVDARHAWAVGSGGALTFTSNGGASWNLRYLGGSSSPDFRAVDFSDTLHGWAVDYGGDVATTADGGQTWEAVAQDVATYGLTGVATNGSRVWVTGDGGLVLSRAASTAGSWQTQDAGIATGLQCITTRGTGAAAGGLGGALSTGTGDGAWTARWRGVGADFQGAAFTDAKHGWVAGKESGGSVALICATSDGGRTWQRQLESDGMNWLGDMAMADAQHGWAVGWGGGIAATSDGSAWVTQVAPTWPAINYNAVAYGDTQHAVAVGYPGAGKNLSITGDGGATWTSPASGVTGTLQDVAFADATHVWAVGDGGAITAGTDAGAMWTAQASGVTDDLLAVDFVDAQEGWAGGRGGVLLHTADGGAHWAQQSSGVTSAIASIRFVTAQKGWAVTDDGQVLETGDGGASWATAGRRCEAGLNQLAVVDSTHVFAAGDAGAVLALDVVRPTARATAPAAAQHRRATVRFSAADAQSGVALVQYRLGSGTWKAGTSVKVTRLGRTVVSYRAKDGAGNVSAVKKVTVRVIR